MRISFVGCPCSGKTTTAAMVFAALKELGISCEFVAEQARLYIAEKRYDQLLNKGEPVTLSDTDQLIIMSRQIHMEKMFKTVCDEGTIIVFDSSPLNSMLYMSESTRQKLDMNTSLEETDLVFYCPPVDRSYEIDINRIHDETESRAIDASIPEVMKRYAPLVWSKMIPLDGDPKARLGQVTSAVLTRRLK